MKDQSKHIELHYHILKEKKLENNQILLVYWSIADDILEDAVTKDVAKLQNICSIVKDLLDMRSREKMTELQISNKNHT
jgi:hypothetical protein